MGVEKIVVVDKSVTKKLVSGAGSTAGVVYSYSGEVVVDAYCNANEDRWSPIGILSHETLPKIGQQYEENGTPIPGVYFTQASPKLDGVRNHCWVWRISYTIEGEGPRSEDAAEVTIVKISSGIETKQYAMPCDLDGKWNTNSVGEFFEEPLMIDNGLMTFNISRREYANPWFKAVNFWNKINSDHTWGLFNPGTLKVKQISPSLDLTSRKTCWTVNYEIQYNPQSWAVKRVDSGYFAYDNAGRLQRLRNDDGSPSESPRLLNGHGQLLGDNQPVVSTDYRMYEWANLSELELVSPFDNLGMGETWYFVP